MTTLVATMNRSDVIDDTAENRLVRDSRRGDGDAYSELVRLHHRRVARLAGRFFRHPEDVEDATQETFVQAWRKLHTYRAEAPFEHWLTRLCLNHCYQRLRRHRPTEEPLPAELPAPPGDPTAGLELERLLSRLPAKDRFLLLLLDGEGWSTAEISLSLGWSRSNVKVRAHRARKKLRRLIEEDL